MIVLAIIIALAFAALLAIIAIAIMDSLDMFVVEEMNKTDWDKFLSENWKK